MIPCFPLNLDKLTPARWTVRETDCYWVAGPMGYPVLLAEDNDEDGEAAVRFAALARNAFDGDPESLAWWEENRRKLDTDGDGVKEQ